MKKAGLKEIMEAKNVPRLQSVFDRLYQDALQRIERLGLIRERMLIANKAYSNIVNALVSDQAEGIGPEQIPDLDRLSSTAAATLSGMWYHTEFLFRNTCEYAIAQGVESSIMKSQKYTLSEVMEAANTDDKISFDQGDDDPNSPNYKARRRGGSGSGNDRLPGRRGGDRPGKNYPGAGAGGDGRAFWSLPGGVGKGPKSPRMERKGCLSDPDPSTFSSYIAALREARGDLKSDEWNRVPLPERNPKLTRSSDAVEFHPKTLKASVSSGSRSLPILPKGRGILQQAPESDPEASNNDRNN